MFRCISVGAEDLNYQIILHLYQMNSEDTNNKGSMMQVSAVEKQSENFVSKLEEGERKRYHIEITIDGHNYILTENTKGLKALRNQINDLENKLKLRNIRLGVDPLGLLKIRVERFFNGLWRCWGWLILDSLCNISLLTVFLAMTIKQHPSLCLSNVQHITHHTVTSKSFAFSRVKL